MTRTRGMRRVRRRCWHMQLQFPWRRAVTWATTIPLTPQPSQYLPPRIPPPLALRSNSSTWLMELGVGASSVSRLLPQASQAHTTTCSSRKRGTYACSRRLLARPRRCSPGSRLGCMPAVTTNACSGHARITVFTAPTLAKPIRQITPSIPSTRASYFSPASSPTRSKPPWRKPTRTATSSPITSASAAACRIELPIARKMAA